MICLSAPREVRFDCGHACCCAACYEELLSEQGRPTNPNPNPNPNPNLGPSCPGLISLTLTLTLAPTLTATLTLTTRQPP